MTLAGTRVFITGATGFLGSVLVRRLIAEGAQVRALARAPARAAALRGLAGVEVVYGDVTDRDSLRAAVEGCAVVIHSAASFTDWRSQQAVNADGTRNVVEAAADAGVSRFVHVSTIAVYGYRHSGDVAETAPMRETSGDPYNRTKIQAERHVTGIASSRGMAYSIIRPGQIYGPGSGMWTGTMFRLASQLRLAFPGDGNGSAHAIHVDDVADLAILLASHPQAVGEAFNGSPDPAPTWREFLGGYRRLTGREGGWLALPVAPVLAATKIAAAFSASRSMTRDAPDLLMMAQGRFSFSTTKARQRLGWTPQVSLTDGIESCTSWLRRQGLLR